jgi:hypothetical protein
MRKRRMWAFAWRRLDREGLDSCCLIQMSNGWRLAGVAVFIEPPSICHLQYEVLADATFRTRHGRVAGYVGRTAIEMRCDVSRAGRWGINGRLDPSLAGCVDVDSGFTPATNLLAIRSLALKTGESATCPAALFSLPSGRFCVLPQRYERIGPREYRYEAPTFAYAGTLRVSPLGTVVSYPGLFELVSPPARHTP